MRIVMDYRPALRDRSGVGEYVHQTARALVLQYPDDSLTLFTSSWKDRPESSVGSDCPGARVSDHRVPVSVLNFAWHQLEWPPIELVTHRRYDLAFSPHPLLLPTRGAAQVVMVHDLDFLRHPERTEREIRRDYPRLAGPHARRASRVVVPSQYTATEVIDRLGVPCRRVLVCPPGAPEWRDPVSERVEKGGYVLFIGTLEPRKNVGGLLEAYGRLLARRPNVPNLVLAGRAGPEAQPWLDAIARAPFAGHVEYLGYVGEQDRQRVYAGARVLVLPSYEEGFGMPALEAMSLGIPVVATNRGALPELVRDAAMLIAPEDVDSIVTALDRVLTEDGLAANLVARGLARARQFEWRQTVRAIHAAFEDAIDERAQQCRGAWRHGHGSP
ncbi:MAG: glycosyltransferase family 4 protein [Acidobacteria bacterium]|nr:glycosyltransferase family 4 protein [Acidobacteriota bacterium]